MRHTVIAILLLLSIATLQVSSAAHGRLKQASNSTTTTASVNNANKNPLKVTITKDANGNLQVVNPDDHPITVPKTFGGILGAVIGVHFADITIYTCFLLVFILGVHSAMVVYWTTNVIIDIIATLFIREVSTVFPHLVSSIITAALFIIFVVVNIIFIHNRHTSTALPYDLEGNQSDDTHNRKPLAKLKRRRQQHEPSIWERIIHYEPRPETRMEAYATLMLVVAALSSYSFRFIMDSRDVNGFGKTFAAALLGYFILWILLAVIVFGVQFFIALVLDKNSKALIIMKYVACGLVLVLGFVPLMIVIATDDV